MLGGGGGGHHIRQALKHNGQAELLASAFIYPIISSALLKKKKCKVMLFTHQLNLCRRGKTKLSCKSGKYKTIVFNKLKIIRLFIRRKIMSIETILSAYMHTNTHTGITHMSTLTIQSLI